MTSQWLYQASTSEVQVKYKVLGMNNINRDAQHE